MLIIGLWFKLKLHESSLSSFRLQFFCQFLKASKVKFTGLA